ncbi:MAG: ankyrin repeat domain-containing protein [Blastocatellia bacterium]|nr:ankyrin repeat domain-containing protein [Blastocatellia bacterium]
MDAIITAIVKDDIEEVQSLLTANPGLVRQLNQRDRLLAAGIFHWIYAGDTILHVASAGHRFSVAHLLLAAGADPNAAGNRRGSTPLHYAADGFITGPEWNARPQVATLRLLVEAGSSLNAQDRNGATALHRATRTRTAEAVQYLLEAGADPMLRNKSGSTPFHLAVQTTGRGDSGKPIARDAQKRIVEVFLAKGVSPHLTDGKGKTVIQCAQGNWVRTLFSEKRA